MSLPDWAEHFHRQLQFLAKHPTSRPVSGGIVVNRQRQLVLVYSDFVSQGWHFPKGGVNEDETSLQGGIVEVQEEAGVEVEAPALASYTLDPSLPFEEKLGFAAPRYEPTEPWHPECVYFGRVVKIPSPREHGHGIGVGTAWLLDRAADLAGIDREPFLAHRDLLLDQWRDMEVTWRNHPEYHVLPFRGYAPHHLCGESTEIRWWTIDELRAALLARKLRMGRAVGVLLQQSGLIEAIDAAAERASE